jgi:hypothetical protein
LSWSIISVTISAVMRSPSHVPHAAAFITLKATESRLNGLGYQQSAATHGTTAWIIIWHDYWKGVAPRLLNGAVLTANVTYG